MNLNPLLRGIFQLYCLYQGEDDDAMSISSRLRDVMIGSEDEMESVLSAPLSPAASVDRHRRAPSPMAGFRGAEGD